MAHQDSVQGLYRCASTQIWEITLNIWIPIADTDQQEEIT